MGIFDKPEVVVLKESSDAKAYLERLEALQKDVSPSTRLADAINKEIAIARAGIIGEDAILFELKNSGMDLVVLHDLYIETSDGRGAQIDYLVVTPYANVFIECKNLFGNIEINNKGEFIRSFSYNGHWVKEGIYSPITQNERHLTVFRDCMGESKSAIARAIYYKSFETYNKSFVVLSNPKTVVNDKFAVREIKQKVIRVDQLISTLKLLKTDEKSSKKAMLALGEKYLALNHEERKEYIEKYQELLEQSKNEQTSATKLVEASQAQTDKVISNTNTNTAEESLICPWCGKQLVVRTAKKGTNEGRRFYGCTSYPACKFIKKID